MRDKMYPSRGGIVDVVAGILLAALLGSDSPLVSAELFSDICNQQLPPARIEVRTRVADPVISFALSASEIKPLSRTTLPGVSLGLTQVEIAVEREISFFTLRSPVDGRMCARPQVVLALALKGADIHVARELKGDNCLVAAVWHHELRHFAIWQETLYAAASDLERMMRAHYDEMVLLNTEGEFRAQMERDIRERWTEEVKALVARGETEHQLLDARDAGASSTWCDGALLRPGTLSPQDNGKR